MSDSKKLKLSGDSRFLQKVALKYLNNQEKGRNFDLVFSQHLAYLYKRRKSWKLVLYCIFIK